MADNRAASTGDDDAGRVDRAEGAEEEAPPRDGSDRPERPPRGQRGPRRSHDSQDGFTREWVETNEATRPLRQGGDPPAVRVPPRPAEGEDGGVLEVVEEDKGIKLGLGDFIFYSILVRSP